MCIEREHRTMIGGPLEHEPCRCVVVPLVDDLDRIRFDAIVLAEPALAERILVLDDLFADAAG